MMLVSMLVFLDILKEHIPSSILLGLFAPWRWRHCILSKHQESLVQEPSILRNSAMRASGFILSCTWIHCGRAERLDQLDSHPYDDGCKICDINYTIMWFVFVYNICCHWFMLSQLTGITSEFCGLYPSYDTHGQTQSVWEADPCNAI